MVFIIITCISSVFSHTLIGDLCAVKTPFGWCMQFWVRCTSKMLDQGNNKLTTRIQWFGSIQHISSCVCVCVRSWPKLATLHTATDFGSDSLRVFVPFGLVIITIYISHLTDKCNRRFCDEIENGTQFWKDDWFMA